MERKFTGGQFGRLHPHPGMLADFLFILHFFLPLQPCNSDNPLAVCVHVCVCMAKVVLHHRVYVGKACGLFSV